jgi:hypothetical protein
LTSCCEVGGWSQPIAVMAPRAMADRLMNAIL